MNIASLELSLVRAAEQSSARRNAVFARWRPGSAPRTPPPPPAMLATNATVVPMERVPCLRVNSVEVFVGAAAVLLCGASVVTGNDGAVDGVHV